MIDDQAKLDAQWSRRRFISGIGAAGLTAGASLLLSPNAFADGGRGGDGDGGGDGDEGITHKLLSAAATAEALATVMYDRLINSSLYREGLNGNDNDRAYLVAGREEETIHYQALTAAGGTPLALTFYFPVGMFTTGHGAQSLQTAADVLITLEDAFIAAYLIAVDRFPRRADRLVAAQILGVEAEHRALGRVIAADLGLSSVTGLSGKAESVLAPNHSVNNIAFERTFAHEGPMLHNINDVVNLLVPFVTPPDSDDPGSFDPTPHSYNTQYNYYLDKKPSVILDSTTP